MLTGLTGKATRVGLYVGRPGQPSTRIASLCKNCKASVNGSLSISPAAAADLMAGTVYVNVATRKNKRGEILGVVQRAG